MQRRAAVILIVALLCTMTTISSYEYSRVNNEYFALDVYYYWHKCTCNYNQFIHDYDTYAIQKSVSIHNYSAAIDHLQVYGFPFWIDVSNWSEGQSVIIGGARYEITRPYQDWNAHRGDYGDYTDLYYAGELGFLISISIDTITLSDLGFAGYSIDVHMESNNLAQLHSYISGQYLIYDNLLVIGIFAELAIIRWLATKTKKNSKESGAESADSYATANSLGVLE